MSAPLLETRRLCRTFGGLTATDSVSLTVPEGELHAIIGPNGAGKTTLIAQLSGELAPSSGSIHFDGREVTALPPHARARLGLARSFQITSIFGNFTALGNVALAVQAGSGHSFRFWAPAAGQRELREPARAILEEVGLGKRAGVLAANLAHGEKRALEIAMALAGRPRLLLLDEPMAGMGPDESALLVQFLAKLKRRYTIVLIEHDMDAVFALADRVTVLVYGQVVASGTTEQVRGDPEVQRAYLGDDEVA